MSSSRAVTAMLVAALIALALVYRDAVVAWFAPSAPGAEPQPDHAHSDDSDIDHYTCSMHPWVNQPGPASCPICGMTLVPVTKAQQAQGVVTIDEARRQLIGVRTGVAIEGPMLRTFQAVGQVAYDESSFTDVNLKVSGWITKLRVTETGQRVTRGQTLFELYSPDLYAAQQDFLSAQRASGAGVAAGATGSLEPLLRAARKRLSLLGLSDAQITSLSAKGEAIENIAIASPASGFVIEKNVVEGASVEAATRLFRIAALDHVWVEADVYVDDLAHVRPGQPASVTLDYLPGQRYDAKVSYVYPYLGGSSRAGKVRVELANKQLELRPGMFARVELSTELGTRVQVPASAVVYTGPRRLVFVDLGQGRFQPREIRIGAEANGMFEVLDGLTPGERVATSGMFLIAAEARISTAATYWQDTRDVEPMAPMGSMAPPAAPATPQEPPPAPRRATARPKAPASPPPPAPPAERDEAHAPVPASSHDHDHDDGVIYQCPMHPEVQSPSPGKCPKCGTDLKPVTGRAPR